MEINRKTCFEVLYDIEKNNSYSNISLNKFILKNNPQNESFVREIVYGVLKNKMYLDYIISQFLKKGINSLGLRELILLRIGTYELKFMNVPSYAAISSTVDLSKSLTKNKSGLINAILRNIDRNPDISIDDLSIKYSINKWILDKIISWYGIDKTIEILEESNKTPNLAIRVNFSKISKDELIKTLNEKGFETSDTSSKSCIFVKGKGLLSLDEFKKGYFSVQDLSSQLLIDNLEIGYEPHNMLDLCAAPGGKSLAFKERFTTCDVISCDIYEHKLNLINKEKDRLGLNINTKLNDARIINSEFIDKFDVVLLDAPCSGFGDFRRKPEIKYKKEFDLEELVNIQREILSNASKYVKMGGLLVYSTCTINPDENEKQVVSFLERNKEFEIEKENIILPSSTNDGFFMAYLRRKNAGRI